ncbi:uncharacterized protein F4812DRAFT_470061 [Daldinia caldariorum]|uniref:uncharacterized protein n=1 Tax=Daldinia caldariorum TaxID=326644 RepID=UPI0020081E0B|nr:uncharacterized protein F4812DRAFT_470061 [Daldinia caldariorum]KAI1470073.1 hypothetical protein F4812DRAFT_470061 [Daldinia caldariorum]
MASLSKEVMPSQSRCTPIFIKLPMETLYEIIYKLSREDLFHWALTCSHFSYRILPVLYKLDLGVEPFMGECEGTYGIYQSLEWACRHGFMGTFEMARELGADLDHILELRTGFSLDHISLSPLHVALFFEHQHIAERLIEGGADVTTLALLDGKYSAMNFATSTSMCMVHRDAEAGAIQGALEAGVTINAVDSAFLMMHAGKNHRLDVVRLFLSGGFRFNEQAMIEEDLGVGAPGICEQLCMTLALQHALAETTCDASVLTELVRLLLAEYESSGILDYRSEITWLVLATGPSIPLAVRALLWDSLIVPRGLPPSTVLAEEWEHNSVGRIMDIVHDVLLGRNDAVADLRDRNLRCILRSIGFCLAAEGGFDWARVQPLVKTLIEESHEHIDVVCTYPTPLMNPHLTADDEALTLELIATLLENGADAEAKLEYDDYKGENEEEEEEEEDYVPDLLHRSMGMGAVRRVRLLLGYGASIDPHTLKEMERPRMFFLDGVDAEWLAEMVDAQREIADMLTSRRRGFGKGSTGSQS